MSELADTFARVTVPVPADREGTEYRRMTPDGRVTGCISVGDGTPAERADSIVAHHSGAVRVL